jgi:hypothetical protein
LIPSNRINSPATTDYHLFRGLPTVPRYHALPLLGIQDQQHIRHVLAAVLHPSHILNFGCGQPGCYPTRLFQARAPVATERAANNAEEYTTAPNTISTASAIGRNPSNVSAWLAASLSNPSDLVRVAHLQQRNIREKSTDFEGILLDSGGYCKLYVGPNCEGGLFNPYGTNHAQVTQKT